VDTAHTEFADFYRHHYPGAVRLAWLLTHDNSVTEDVVQDAFVRLQPRFESAVDRPAYLRTCVVNGCRDRARGDKRSAARFRLVSATERSIATDSPSELIDAVATLPYNQRAAVVLRYWADLPETDIARILGVRPGTVRTLVARALTSLRKDIPQ
jgi:RNA polymerase sigma factor (sigma-70 family)